MTTRSDNKRRLRWLAYCAISLGVHACLFWLFDVPDQPETIVTTITITKAEVPEPEVSPEPDVVVEDDEVVRDREVETAELDPDAESAPDLRTDVSPAPTSVAARFEPLSPPPDPIAELEPEPEPEPEPQPAPEEDLRSVFQPDRDADAPEEASALAEFDNSTDVETMPEETADWTEESGQNEDTNESEEPEDEALSELSPSLNEDESDSVEEEAAVEEIAAHEEHEHVALGREEGTADENLEELEAIEGREETEASEEVADVEEPEQIEPVAGAGPAEVVSPLDRFRPQYAVAQIQRAAREGRLAAVARGAEDGGDETAYQEVLGERAERDSERVAREAREASLVGDHDALWEHTRHALENYDVSVTPGSELSLNTRSDEAAAYIHYLHDKIHERWWAYLSQWDLYSGPMSPLADYSLVVELEFGIRRDGEVDRVSIANGSGTALFDGPAVGLLWAIGPHRPPPAGLIGSDGKTHVRWSFHRDNRGCISSGASVRRVQVSEGEGG